MEDLEKFVQHCRALLVLDMLQSTGGGADFLAAWVTLCSAGRHCLIWKVPHAEESFYSITMTLTSFESFEYFIFVCDMLNKVDEGSKDYINLREAVV